QFAFTGGGGGSAPGDLRAYAQERLREYGLADQWWALDRLVQKESGWNPRAQNPRSTAFGLFQFLDSTWATVGARKTADPHAQIDAGLRYIAQRYGSPTAALAFHNRNGWYNEGGEVLPTGVYVAGGFLPQGASIAINNTGAPEPVGIDYDRLAKALAKALSASGVGDSVTFVTGVFEARLLH